MAHTHTQSNPDETKREFELAVAKGYEPHDLKLRGVFLFVAFLTLTLVIVLSAIFAIMIALVDHSRGGDPVSSPVAVTPAPVYAPLQPSPEHDWLDQDDMLLMRAKTQKAINSSGTSSTGRRYIAINDAIRQVVDTNMLPIKAVVEPVYQTPNPPGTFEGYTPNLEAVQPAGSASPNAEARSETR